MKRLFKILSLVIVLFLLCGNSVSQTVIFWTSNVDALPIKVYMNGRYIGSITKAYRSAPSCYTSGCVTVEPSNKSNTWRAESKSIGAETSGNYQLSSGCNSLQLFANGRKLSGNPYQSSSSHNDSDQTNSNRGSTSPNAAAGAGMAVVALAVVAAEFLLNSDLYVTGTLSSQYGGLEFGFRNNWNKHICLEQIVVWRYEINPPIPHFLNTDSYRQNSFFDYQNGYSHRRRSNWGCNFRFLYNFFDRDYTFRNTDFMLNPYIGFGCDYMQYDGFFTSAMAGFTFGSRRVKMDCRYTFGYDFRYQNVVVNQLQLGLIVSYQYRKFGFFRRR